VGAPLGEEAAQELGFVPLQLCLSVLTHHLLKLMPICRSAAPRVSALLLPSTLEAYRKLLLLLLRCCCGAAAVLLRAGGAAATGADGATTAAAELLLALRASYIDERD